MTNDFCLRHFFRNYFSFRDN